MWAWVTPRSDLAAHASGFFFKDTRGLQAVQKLLQEARDKMQLVCAIVGPKHPREVTGMVDEGIM